MFCNFLIYRFKVNGTYNIYDEEFMKFVGHYKFTIAIENSVCIDYITEKLWRPLIVGSVPIYLGSPTIKVSNATEPLTYQSMSFKQVI